MTAGFMDSSIRKRSVTIAGHSTSVSLEAAFWDALKHIAAARDVSINALIESIDEGRSGNLSSAIRVFVLAEVSKAGVPDSAGGSEGE
jgi:predicted DNA-binding ribbon-helix-helix protein